MPANAASESALLDAAEPFDDGFIPPTKLDAPTKLLRNAQPSKLNGLHVLPNAISESAAREAYKFTTSRPRDEPGQQEWGTYFKIDGEDGSGKLQLHLRGAEPEVETLAATLLQEFYSTARDLLKPDLSKIHGFSVWAVVGGPNTETAYHIDYAEVFRRQTNVIIPPIHAATLQVAPIEEGDTQVLGGKFGANSGGLEHYRKLGYKARRDPGKRHPRYPTSDWVEGENAGWSFAPYTFRQATLSSGELPHAADRVIVWPKGVQRVVVGLNSMGFVEGPTECKLPQHSYDFRLMLKLELLCRKAGGPEGVAKMLLEHVKKKRGQAQSAASDETVAEEEKSSSINDGGNGSKSNRNSKGDTSDGGCSKQEPHEVIDVA